jgi:hypothetical protein
MVSDPEGLPQRFNGSLGRIERRSTLVWIHMSMHIISKASSAVTPSATARRGREVPADQSGRSGSGERPNV